MKVQAKHGKVTQNMHGASRNYRYIWDVSSSDKGIRRARAQEVNATMPLIPQYMHWSECDISWGRADHPSILLNPGNYPLVVDALFAGQRFSCKFSRVLIDGGSTINILYRDTLIKLGLTERDLERSRTKFHGIVPGSVLHPHRLHPTGCHIRHRGE